MISVLKYLFVLILFLLCAAVIGLYGFFALAQNGGLRALLTDPRTYSTTQITALALMASLPVVFAVLFLPLVQISSNRGWFGTFVRTLLILAMAGFIGFQFYDDRKLYEPHSAKELISRDPAGGRATFLFSPILNQSSRPIPDSSRLSGNAFYQNITAHQETIEQDWRDITTYRVSIDQLSSLDVLPQSPPEPDRPAADYTGMRNILRIYLAYALLQVEQGNLQGGIEQLAVIHRVARHGLAGAIDLETRMIWAQMVEDTLRAGFQVGATETAGGREIKSLLDNFIPLSQEEVSFHRIWLGEYLSAQDRCLWSGKQIRSELIAGSNGQAPWPLQMIPDWLFDPFYLLTFQSNRSARVLQSFWQPIIEAARNSVPSFNRAGFSLEQYDRNPPLRNLSGWYFHRPKDHLAEEQEIVRLIGKSDLLAAYLKSKLEIGSTIDSFTTGNYGRIIYDQGRLSAVGEDGKAGGNDDIILQTLR